jgi:hypothetical protein
MGPAEMHSTDESTMRNPHLAILVDSVTTVDHIDATG